MGAGRKKLRWLIAANEHSPLAPFKDQFSRFRIFLFQLLNLQRFLDTPSANSMSAGLGRWMSVKLCRLKK